MDLGSIGRALRARGLSLISPPPSWLISEPPTDLLSPEDRAIVRQIRKGFPPLPSDAITTTQRSCIERLLEVIERAAPDSGYQEWAERR